MPDLELNATAKKRDRAASRNLTLIITIGITAAICLGALAYVFRADIPGLGGHAPAELAGPAPSGPTPASPAPTPSPSSAPETDAAEPAAPAAETVSTAEPSNSIDDLIREANENFAENKPDAALAAIDQVLAKDPKKMEAYMMRGAIYGQRKQWADAEHAYQTAQDLAPSNTQIAFDRAELKFMQKSYDVARQKFAALQNDPNLGDLASFKVFLCDLVTGHEATAESEMNAMDRLEETPAYYFSNAAWDYAHHKADDGDDWITSATKIYRVEPGKLGAYDYTLREAGFTPFVSVQ